MFLMFYYLILGYYPKEDLLGQRTQYNAHKIIVDTVKYS